MGFLNTLTELEKSELSSLSSQYHLVHKLCNELKIYEEDAVKSFYAALNKAILDVTTDIHNGELDMDKPFTKSIIKLAESGDKIFNTLQRGKQDSTGEKLKDANTDEKPRSFLDKKADSQKIV